MCHVTAGGRVPCEGISPSEAQPMLRVQWAGGRDADDHVPVAHQAGDTLLVQSPWSPQNLCPGRLLLATPDPCTCLEDVVAYSFQPCSMQARPVKAKSLRDYVEVVWN